jgi:hypothetical protein
MAAMDIFFLGGGAFSYIIDGRFPKIFECRNWETEHYNSVLEITVSFLVLHEWEPDIYIRFSPALHLQGTDACFV